MYPKHTIFHFENGSTGHKESLGPRIKGALGPLGNGFERP